MSPHAAASSALYVYHLSVTLVLFHRCLLIMQLDKAQTQHGRWQSMGSTNPDKKRLGADVEDECKSIAWQASFPSTGKVTGISLGIAVQHTSWATHNLHSTCSLLSSAFSH